MIGYPKWFSKNLIHTLFFLSLITGLILLPTVLVLKLEWNLPWRLPTEHRDWIVVFHVMFGFIVFTVLGALSSLHVRIGFRKKAKIASGVTLIGLIVLLGFTGLGVLYFGNEKLSTYSSVIHFIVGLSMATIYIVHITALKNKN